MCGSRFQHFRFVLGGLSFPSHVKNSTDHQAPLSTSSLPSILFTCRCSVPLFRRASIAVVDCGYGQCALSAQEVWTWFPPARLWSARAVLREFAFRIWNELSAMRSWCFARLNLLFRQLYEKCMTNITVFIQTNN